MRLSRITLNGFKSFADATEFRFDAPITGVVGPNGCGKSNVVDAIKWVLGERSAKTLRGKEMADVIFAGSAGRKPSGMASVSLVFENPPLDADRLAVLRASVAEGVGPDAAATDPLDADDERALGVGIDRANRTRLLPIDTEEVAVERRLYRDGKSQYLINGRIARLRDIRELFLDTGVGADAYSIIEQGKVDAMLLANPVERRTFFEEAAGIARFKSRRIEAQRKLERTETNLVRTREQLENAERRLRMVRGQAAKARRFVELDHELRASRLALAFDQYDTLRRQRIDLDGETAAIEGRRTDSLREVETLEEEKQQAELARHELQRARDERRHQSESAEQRRTNADQRASIAARNLAEAERQLTTERERDARLVERIAQLEGEVGASGRAIEELTALQAEAETALRDAGERREAHQAELAELKLEAGRARAATAALDRERVQARARLEAEDRRVAGLSEQITALESRHTELLAERAEADARSADTDERIEELSETMVELQRNLNAKIASATSLSDDQRRVAAELNTLEQEWTRLDGRRQTLEEMAAHRVGLGEAVREVLERRDALSPEARAAHPLYRRLIAPLAEMIDVDPRHAAAVEAALGNALGALVIEGDAEAVAAVAGEALPGRVVFALDTGSPRVVHDGGMGLPGVIAENLVSDPTPGVRDITSLVNADGPARAIIDRLLRGTYLAPSIESATLLAAGPMRGARFVTPDGAVIETDGRIAVGPLGGEHESAGVLARAGELQAVRADLTRLRERTDRKRRDLQSVDSQASSLDEELGELRRILADRERRHAAAESDRDRLASERHRLARELERIGDELDTASGRRESLVGERRDLAGSIEALEKRFAESDERSGSLDVRAETASLRLEETSEVLSLARVRAKEAEERAAAAEREQRRLRHQIEDAEEQHQRTADAIAYRESKSVEERSAIDEARREMDRASGELAEAKEALASLADELSDATERVYRLGDRLATAREQASGVTNEWNRIELAKRENEIHTENLERRVSEDLAVDLHAEYPDYRDVVSDERVSPIDRSELAALADDLAREIKRLGNVNIDAIEEESELEERNEDLIDQVADIDRAREQLEQLIDRLSAVSRERFESAFRTIQSNFSGNDGMFRKLFGGGRAEIELIPDEETGEVDWLESGVRVTAKPPGKEPRSISQLSGGEKTMTAVALLLAIFESKPSPFCVLDEVDAALDDANVERFGAVIRQFLDRCHFIVITHNKRTMSITDILYGVTMQERGVSRRVAVRFEDVSEQGEIRTPAKRSIEPTRHDAGVTPAAEVESKDPSPRFSDALRSGAEAQADIEEAAGSGVPA